MPLLTFRMETQQPCLIPSQSNRTTVPYPTEKDRGQGICSKINGIQTDNGYMKLEGYTIGEFELREDTGVLDILQDQPIHEQYINRTEIVRKREVLSVYARPTIEIKPSCSVGETI